MAERVSEQPRQIGTALSAYLASHNVFPLAGNDRIYSPHAMILPYLDQRGLYDSINFNLSVQTILPTDPYGPHMTAHNTKLAVFLCPADSQNGATIGQTNYAGNGGYGETSDGGILGLGLFADAATPQGRTAIGAQAVPDGLSNTVALSEWVLGNYWTIEPMGTLFQTPPLVDLSEFEEFVATCRDLPPDSTDLAPGRLKSCRWLFGGFEETLLNHDLTINGHSCLNGSSVNYGAWTAGSRHAGGANVLFADAHVRFLSDRVSLPVWRALSTRAGQEALAADSY